MRFFFRALWWAFTLPIRIVWKLRKLIIVVGGAAAAYAGWQKRQNSTADDAPGETPAV